jgi:cellulose synthase/poly-beta-1,6-N-acetylglucosamine synthase-like glycosyltransferase
VIVAWSVIVLGLAWVGFAYVGYPLLLWALRRISPRPVRRGDVTPAVSVVIAVHDGAHELEKKLVSTLAQEYPGDLEIIVASDGSTDDTDAIAASFADRGVVLVRNPERGGKEAAQALGIAKARGEVLVFTDVSAELVPGALRKIVRPFADPEVGCVSSEDRIDSSEGEGAYVRYEMALRRLENEATTLIGLSGSFFAARRELCSPWPTDLASDFRTPLEAARRGLRAVSEPEAQASFRVTSEPGAEWSRKVRTVRRGIAVLTRYADVLSPAHGRAAFSLWGHKVARFTSPLALVAVFVASAAAAPGSPLAAALLAGQCLAYGLGSAALAWPPLSRLLVPRLAAFFLLVNASMLVAWGYHLTGRRAVTWQPTRR